MNTTMEANTDKEKIAQLEARIVWLENKLWMACENIYKIGYEMDGGRTVERFGVDATAARHIVEAIGPWQRTNIQSVPNAQLLPAPTIKHQRPASTAVVNKPVTWSKELRGGWL